ncbi:MAG: glycoside hydrolase family 9 protein [Acidobacteria bacterium]|nr:glycoside hydrolase family 9 protein [Acidobacteriota bacterium]
MHKAILLGLLAAYATVPQGQVGGVWIRASQIGYLPGDRKIAILSADAPLSGKFSVGDFAADIGPDQGPWGPFQHNYRLDFTAQMKPGRYVVRFGEIGSLPLRIGEDVYEDVPRRLLDFVRLQRCGNNPVTGKQCHQKDAIDSETGERVGLVGGWHDAADRIKHMITTSYSVAALLLAGAEEEGRYGASFLKKIHPEADTLYVQIGDDRDHGLPFTLWHEDSVDYGWGPGGARPAWRATGKPQGPRYRNASTGLASLAGRCAAALAIAGDLDRARSLYTLAKKNPGCAQSVPVKAFYYYGERTYHDDLEWAAVELYRATKDRQYLEEAIRYAHLAHDESWMGKAWHGHYEYFPYVNLAHWRLYEFVDNDTKVKIATYYRKGLEEVRRRAEQNAYRLGTPLVWCSTNDVIAFATQAVLYEKMTSDRRYRGLAAEARDWIFGRNPWGVSFVCGVPEGGVASSKPHHLFYKLVNRLPVGGLVDGPVYGEINRALQHAPFGEDPYARFQSDLAVYHDDFNDFATNEPILDGTASLLLLLRLWQD